MTSCPNCGHDNLGAPRFCELCRSNMTKAQEQQKPPPPWPMPVPDTGMKSAYDTRD